MNNRLRSLASYLAFLGISGCGTEGGDIDSARYANGERVFEYECAGCHAVTGKRNSIGPSLTNIIGREAGAVAAFGYSTSLTESGITWNDENLDDYLANPMEFIPGNNMGVTGIADPDERTDVIYFLRHATRQP